MSPPGRLPGALTGRLQPQPPLDSCLLRGRNKCRIPKGDQVHSLMASHEFSTYEDVNIEDL